MRRELLAPPEWHRDALYLEHPELTWFPERGQPSTAAQEVCRRCPVQGECLAYALESGEEDGIWGGMTPRGRRTLLKGTVALEACTVAGCDQEVASASGSRCAGHERSCWTPGCSRQRIGRARWCSACR